MKLILGTVQFGSNYGIKQDGQPSPAEIKRILKFAKHVGIDTIDTAPAYNCNCDFTGFKVIQKTPYWGDAYALLQHDPDGPILPVLNAWRQNIIEKIGISVYTPEQLEKVIRKRYPVDIIQLPLNIADNRFIPYLPLLRENEIEIHARSVLLQGALLIGAYGLPKYTVAECLGFVLNQAIDYAVVGVNSEAQLRELTEVVPMQVEGLNVTDWRIDPTKWVDKR